MADFCSLADVKAALAIGDASQDGPIQLAIPAATAIILDELNRDPRVDDFVEQTDGRGLSELLVRQYPINSVDSVTLDSGLVIPADQIGFTSNVVFWKQGRFPRGRRNVTVAYNAGLDPLPRSIKTAAIYTVRAILAASQVDLNALGESWGGVTGSQWQPGGPGTVPIAARTLLAQFVNPWNPS